MQPGPRFTRQEVPAAGDAGRGGRPGWC